jgi:hypothetical protein
MNYAEFAVKVGEIATGLAVMTAVNSCDYGGE